jgi:hypothetical protein
MSPPDQPRPDPPPPDLDLAAHVASADAALAARGARAPTGALLRVSATDADTPGELAWFPIDPIHPLDLLLGFVAPTHWWALGVSSCGRQHPIDDDGRVVRSASSPRVRITVLIDRSGGGAGLLRRGGERTALPGPPDGTVGDACRRALGLDTAPPPPTTAGLWTRCWLDRVVDALAPSGGTGGGPGPPTWRDLTRLHPASTVAATHRSDVGLGPDADAVADATRALADAWPWARLRADPVVVDVPGPLPDARVIAWMDDGMWARWLLAAFPALDDLVDAACSLLAPKLARATRQAVEASIGWAAPADTRESPT